MPSVEMAAALLEDQGIATHRRWEHAGGVQFGASENALLPGRIAVLMVPTIAYDEAKEALGGFNQPEPEYFTELTSEVQANQRKRRGVAAVILFILFAPFALAVIALLIVVIGSFFR